MKILDQTTAATSHPSAIAAVARGSTTLDAGMMGDKRASEGAAGDVGSVWLAHMSTRTNVAPGRLKTLPIRIGAIGAIAAAALPTRLGSRSGARDGNPGASRRPASGALDQPPHVVAFCNQRTITFNRVD